MPHPEDVPARLNGAGNNGYGRPVPTVAELIEAQLAIAAEWDRRRIAKQARDRRHRAKKRAQPPEQLELQWPW